MWNYKDYSNVKMPDTEMTVAKLEEAEVHLFRKANETSMSASDIAEKLALGMAQLQERKEGS